LEFEVNYFGLFFHHFWLIIGSFDPLLAHFVTISLLFITDLFTGPMAPSCYAF